MPLLPQSLLPVLFVLFIGCANNRTESNETARDTWTLTGFTKNDTANPVMTATDTLVFDCPLQKTQVKWAEKDVFNPAAIVRNDTLFLLFRAEDRIGRYAGTSRIGLAWSLDGLRFTAHPQPVLYPAEDSFSRL